MCFKLSPSDLQTILDEAAMAARRLLRKMRLPHEDLADIRQDLLADLIARLPAFDPSRGTIGAFAGMVMANRATRLAHRVRLDRRMFGAVPVSLDDPIQSSDGTTLGDITAENEGLSAYWGQPVDAFAQAEQRIDLERGLGTLGETQRILVAALYRGGTAHRLAESGFGSRSELYRRTREIRFSLVAAGLGRFANGVSRSWV